MGKKGVNCQEWKCLKSVVIHCRAGDENQCERYSLIRLVLNELQLAFHRRTHCCAITILLVKPREHGNVSQALL